MKKVKDYSDFIIDSLFESIGNQGVLPFVFSKDFEEIIKSINHPIADDLLNNENQNEPVTLIDITDKNDLVSFATSPKIIEFLMDSNNKPKDEVTGIDFFKYLRTDRNLLMSKYRSTIKIGKLVKKIFNDKYPDNGKPGRDIESFVNIYKSVFDKDDIMDLFEIVEGEDIQKWYDDDRYAENSSGSELYQSCMNGCYDYIRFYAINKEHIKMLILYEDDRKRKIVGRALVWNLDIPENRTFMDRIYTVHNYQVDFFKEYAKRKGWLYKSVQSYGNETIVDSKIDNDSGDFMDLTVWDIKLNNEYPYMDTLRYLDQDKKILSTRNISDVKLISTTGDPQSCEWSEKYNRWINMNNLGNGYVICEIGKERYTDDIDNVRKKDDAVFLPYYDEWVSEDKYDELIVKTSIPTEQELLKTDCVYLKHYGGWAEENYVDKKFEYSVYEDDYLEPNDMVFSKTLDSYIIADKATDVYTDETKEFTDYIPDKELNNYTYTINGDYILNK